MKFPVGKKKKVTCRETRPPRLLQGTPKQTKSSSKETHHTQDTTGMYYVIIYFYQYIHTYILIFVYVECCMYARGVQYKETIKLMLKLLFYLIINVTCFLSSSVYSDNIKGFSGTSIWCSSTTFVSVRGKGWKCHSKHEELSADKSKTPSETECGTSRDSAKKVCQKI